MNHTEMKQEHMSMIVKSLMTEYSKEESLKMLEAASYSKIEDGYKVTYANGVEDKFFFVLTHESDI